MKFFGDTANLDELKELDEMGILSGITTNPTIIARNGKNALEIWRSLTNAFPDMPVFGQVVAVSPDDIIREAKIINSAGRNMVVKIPAARAAIKTIKFLKKLGIKTCATAVLTAAQGFLCASAGADYVAPYTGQNDVIGFDGFMTLKQLCEAVHSSGLKTEILAASLHKPQELVECALAGADIATAPFDVFAQAFDAPMPLTKFYSDRFLKDWNDAGCVMALSD